jgi:hypothetical protein
MIPDNFKELLEKLKAKTLNRQAIWTKTSGDDEYKLDFGKGAVTVDRWVNPGDGNEYTECVIFNEDGNKVERIAVSDTEKAEFDTISELHLLARNAFFKTDETFKSLFKELDSDDIIGNNPGGDLIISS